MKTPQNTVCPPDEEGRGRSGAERLYIAAVSSWQGRRGRVTARSPVSTPPPPGFPTRPHHHTRIVTRRVGAATCVPPPLPFLLPSFSSLLYPPFPATLWWPTRTSKKSTTKTTSLSVSHVPPRRPPTPITCSPWPGSRGASPVRRNAVQCSPVDSVAQAQGGGREGSRPSPGEASPPRLHPVLGP